MPLSDIVTVNITTSTASPTRPGFGQPLIAAYVSSTIIPGRSMQFGSLTEMVSAGFAVTDPAYLCASKIFSQNPSVKDIKVGRRALAFSQVVQLTCLGIASPLQYSMKVGGQQVTVTGTGTANGDAAALTTAINALSISGLTTTNPGAPSAIVQLAMSSGKLIDVQFDTTHTTVADTTADPGIATDLAAILAVDTDWYGLLLDSNSPAEILATAAWAEANGPKLFLTNCSDTAIMNPSSTTDVAFELKSFSYARTALLMSKTSLLSYSGAAWMGNRFPFDPGSDTWAFKTLAGVAADIMSDAQVHAVENKNANVYTTVAGLNITQFGITPSGEFIDVVRGIDWLRSELQISVFGLLANNAKIPFTDSGIDAIRSTILGVMQEGIDAGLLAASPKPIVSTPTAASVDSIDKSKRNLPNVTFSATLAGAIHATTISGTVSS